MPEQPSVKDRWPLLYQGLNQMPTDGVERSLKRCREDGRHILVNGYVAVEEDGEFFY